MAQFDSTSMWGTPPDEPNPRDKSNASVLLDFANGRIYYQAMGTSLFSASQQANFGVNADEPPSLENNFWGITQTETGNTNDGNDEVKVRTRYLHRHGINEVLLQGKARLTRSSTGGTWNSNAGIRLEVKASENGSAIESSSQLIPHINSYGDISISLDGLDNSLTEGNYYLIEITLYSNIDGDLGNGYSDQMTIRTFLREDIYLTTGT